jgi:putative radical SAM enzyme (TIGR03279 family)
VVRIAEIEAGSIADELHLEIGTRIVRINGQRVRDGIDLTYLLADSELELETLSPEGIRKFLEIHREEGEGLGIVPAPDAIRECANKCVFCFIDGNPKDVRPTLWLRDDDFRLSFTYGSYVTLTNLGPKGLQRLIDQRISPIYVSVHATEPEVRVRLLKNDRAGLIMDQLRFLLENGLEVHTQVVLCPGWNDGTHLERTMRDLMTLGEGIRSLSVVPVGLTKYNIHRPVRPLEPEEAGRAIDQVDSVRVRARVERNQGWVYCADEMYLHAGHPLPSAEYYDSWDLTENGVGSVSGFLAAFQAGLPDVPHLEGRRIRILTGRSMAPFMEDLAPSLRQATGASVQVSPVANEFFGPSVTVAGLLAGQDLLLAVPPDVGSEDVILVPAEALNADDLFIDSMSLSDFRKVVAPARVMAGLEITEALRKL